MIYSFAPIFSNSNPVASAKKKKAKKRRNPLRNEEQKTDEQPENRNAEADKEAAFATLTWESPKQLVIHAIVEDKHFIMMIFVKGDPIPPFTLRDTKLKYNNLQDLDERDHGCSGTINGETSDSIRLCLGRSAVLHGKLDVTVEKKPSFELDGLGSWRIQSMYSSL